MQWVSNSQHVLDPIPASEGAKNVREMDLSCDELPSERAMGVLWTVESDVFGFHVNVPEKPATPRSILSIISSFTTPLEWQPQLLWMERWLFRICAAWSWVGMIVFQMMSAPDGSSGCKLCPVWTILWSRDVMFQRILECCFWRSFIITLMHVSLVTDMFLTCASQTSLVMCIGPSLLASHVLLDWSKWLSLGWSLLLQFLQLGLMSNSGMNLTLLWATASFGHTVPLCWVTWKIKGPVSTSLLRTGWLWFEEIHHLLNGIMCHQVLTQQTTLPEVWMEKSFFNVTGGRLGLGFCGVQRKCGQCNQIVMVLMTTILRSK